MAGLPASADATCRDTWVHLPGGRLFVRVWKPQDTVGQMDPRAPIVLFHDSLGCVATWRGFPARLSAATGRAVIGYDRLGFGRSDPQAGELSLDFIADEAATAFPVLREELGLDRFVLFGHSVGGGMAIHCAAAYPHACEAVVTEAAQAFGEDRTTAGIRESEQIFRKADQFTRLERYHGDKARWVLRAWVDTWLDPDFADWSLRPVLPQVTSPLLAIHGSQDEYGSTAHPELIPNLAGGPSHSEVLDGIHHIPHKEAEPLVLNLAVEFLDSTSQ